MYLCFFDLVFVLAVNLAELRCVAVILSKATVSSVKKTKMPPSWFYPTHCDSKHALFC